MHCFTWNHKQVTVFDCIRCYRSFDCCIVTCSSSEILSFLQLYQHLLILFSITINKTQIFICKSLIRGSIYTVRVMDTCSSSFILILIYLLTLFFCQVKRIAWASAINLYTHRWFRGGLPGRELIHPIGGFC